MVAIPEEKCPWSNFFLDLAKERERSTKVKFKTRIKERAVNF